MMTTLHKFVTRNRKRSAHEELMRLDARVLRDVGLTRVEIPALDAETLDRFDNRMLSDIGFVRGDFDRAAYKNSEHRCIRQSGEYVMAA